MSDGANVIDEFVVAFGLDPANFNAGQKDVINKLKKLKQEATKNAKDLEEEGKKGAEYFASMKREALGLFATLVGANGIKNFTANTTASFAAMGRSAQMMGMNVSQLAAFQNMIVRNGGSAASARAELEGLAKQMTEWKLTGNTANRGYFSFFGADPNDDPIKVLEKFSKWAATVDPKVANMVGSAIGLDPETINQLIKGQAAFNAELAKSRKLGVPTDAEVKKSQELQRAWFELKQAVTGDAQVLLEDMTPALVTILNAVAKGIETFPHLTEAVIALGVALTGLSTIKTATGLLGWLLGLGGKAGAAKAVATAAETSVAEGAGGAAGVGAGIDGLVAGGAAAGGGAAAAGGGLGVAGTAAAVAAPVAAFLGGIGAFGKAGEKDEADKLVQAQALAMIKSREGFKANAYWDRNAFRVGYGSDTVTDAKTGMVSKVTARTAGVTRDMADADLSRRITKEFMPRAKSQAGDAWDKLDPRTRAALVDMAYNYGSLPKDVAAATKTGNRDQIAAAILAHKGDNQGINASRRLQEANAVRGAGVAAAKQAQGPTTVTVQVGDVTVNTQATDAQGIARDTAGAVKDEFASQMNTGLSY